MAKKKMKKDLDAIASGVVPGVSVHEAEESVWHVGLTVRDGLMSGGVFWFEVQFPAGYPFKPPQLRLLSRVFHPNFAADRCSMAPLSCISPEKWAPTTPLTQILSEILQLLQEPDPSRVVNHECFALMQGDNVQFHQKIVDSIAKFNPSEGAAAAVLSRVNLVMYEQLAGLFPDIPERILVSVAAESDPANLEIAIDAVLSKISESGPPPQSGVARSLSQMSAGDSDTACLAAASEKSRIDLGKIDEGDVDLLSVVLPSVDSPTLRVMYVENDLDLIKTAAICHSHRAEDSHFSHEGWQVLSIVERIQVSIPTATATQIKELLKENTAVETWRILMRELIAARDGSAAGGGGAAAGAKGKDKRKGKGGAAEGDGTLSRTRSNPAPLFSHDGWEIIFNYTLKKNGKVAQSMRSLFAHESAKQIVLSQVGSDNTAAYAAACFETMLEREEELSDEFCVLYHSYNAAALLYEIQSVVARTIYDLPQDFAPLPRILEQSFAGKNLQQLLDDFTKMSSQDHNPAFRALAISVSTTLFAFGSEAPPLQCFRAGYGCMDVSFRALLTDLLKTIGCPSSQVESMADELVKLGEKFGLSVYAYASSGYHYGSYHQLGGHMLQIFIHKSVIDDIAYRSQPYGIRINDGHKLSQYLGGIVDGDKEGMSSKGKRAVDGQARVMMIPEIFTDLSKSRLYHYCGAWEYLGGDITMEGSRAAFTHEVLKILSPMLGTQEGREIAREGVKGDKSVAEAAAAAAAAGGGGGGISSFFGGGKKEAKKEAKKKGKK